MWRGRGGGVIAHGRAARPRPRDRDPALFRRARGARCQSGRPSPPRPGPLTGWLVPRFIHVAVPARTRLRWPRPGASCAIWLLRALLSVSGRGVRVIHVAHVRGHVRWGEGVPDRASKRKGIRVGRARARLDFGPLCRHFVSISSDRFTPAVVPRRCAGGLLLCLRPSRPSWARGKHPPAA